MNLKIIAIASLLAISAVAACQQESEINNTDQQGRKQGHWIKKYPNQSVMYDGIFKNDHPIGEFKRYYEDKTLKSVLNYNDDGTEATAIIYHPNGFVSSRGKYVNQLKEGKWQFFSIDLDRYLICEETYSKNLRNGPSLKFYPDGKLSETLNYVNDIKDGEWIQYYANGSQCLKSIYVKGKINGKFEVWFENGKIEFSGHYKNELKEGLWYIYKKDGTLKYKLEYLAGYTRDRQMDIDESDFLDSLEFNKGKIADPEKTGVIR